jgi:hypothetical protein
MTSTSGIQHDTLRSVRYAFVLIWSCKIRLWWYPEICKIRFWWYPEICKIRFCTIQHDTLRSVWYTFVLFNMILWDLYDTLLYYSTWYSEICKIRLWWYPEIGKIHFCFYTIQHDTLRSVRYAFVFILSSSWSGWHVYICLSFFLSRFMVLFTF